MTERSDGPSIENASAETVSVDKLVTLELSSLSSDPFLFLSLII